MSQATNYALRFVRAAGFAWGDFVRDVRDGALATARVVVTFTGCAALIALASALSNETTRTQLADLVARSLPVVASAEAEPVETLVDAPPAASARPTVDARQKYVVQYLARRYRVAEEATRMLVAHAFEIGQEKKLDPLLILSVVAIESSLNPFAASPVGAQGLMQVMTRVHTERFVAHGGDIAALDPVANMKVGSDILHELISRGGSVERGLQLYVGAGNMDDDGGYGARVLGERARLQLAFAGRVDAAIAAGRAADVRPAAAAAAPTEPTTPLTEAPRQISADQHT